MAATPQAKPVEADYYGTLEFVDMSDEEYRNHVYRREDRHRNLAKAMTQRVLTKREFAEVSSEGYRILTQDGLPYYPEEVKDRFDKMMEIQTRLRLYSEHLKRMENK